MTSAFFPREWGTLSGERQGTLQSCFGAGERRAGGQRLPEAQHSQHHNRKLTSAMGVRSRKPVSESQHRSPGSASCSRRFQGMSPLGLVASCSTLPDPPAFCAAFCVKNRKRCSHQTRVCAAMPMPLAAADCGSGAVPRKPPGVDPGCEAV